MSKVFKRKWKIKNGEKSCWAFDYLNTFGKRKIVSGFNTKAEAEREYSKVVCNIQDGNKVTENKKITFEEAANLYLELHVEVHCRKNTVTGYKGYLRNHILPFLGQMKLIDINPMVIQKFIQIKLKTELSKETINKLIILIGSIFQKMVDDEIINKNPVKKIKKLKPDHKEELKILSVEEIKILLDTTKLHYNDFYPLLVTALYTGMRQGELLALTWEKINWITHKLSVDKSYSHGYLDIPKTRNSIRKVDMSKELAKVLKKWQIQCPPGKDNLVFPNSSGEYQDANNLIKRRFLPVLRRAGLARIRFHDLRHTYASLLLAKNIPAKYIQNQLGHSSIQITMDRYAHIMPEIREQSVNILDNLFEKEEIKQRLAI